MIIPRRITRGFTGNILKILSFPLRNNIIDGPYVSLFEKKFASEINIKHTLSTSSGRQALAMILDGLNLKKNSEILIPAYTLISLYDIILSKGFRPVAVDIEKESLNIDINDLKGKISSQSACLVVTHMFGVPCKVDLIKKICDQYGVYLIEDCAHAHGCSYKNQPTGTFGIASFFSFDSIKPISTIFGGIVATNDDNLFQTLTKLQKGHHFPSRAALLFKIFEKFCEHLILSSCLFSLFIPIFYFDFTQRLFNSSYILFSRKKNLNEKFTNLQGFIGLNELNVYKERNKKRKYNSGYIIENTNIQTQHILPHSVTSDYFLIAFSPKQAVRALQKKLLLKGIDIHIREELANACHVRAGKKAPNTDIAYGSVFQIPNHENLKPKHLNKITEALSSI